MGKMIEDIIIAPIISEESVSLMSGEKNRIRKDPKEVMKSDRYKKKAAKAEKAGKTLGEPKPPKPVQKKYVFKVDRRATKPEIAKAIEAMFKVSVADVNTINMKRKPKRLGYHSGYTSAWKKAVVTLKPDSKTIEFFNDFN